MQVIGSKTTCGKKKNSENLAGIFYFHFHIDKELLGVLPFSITNTIKHKVSLAHFTDHPMGALEVTVSFLFHQWYMLQFV